MQDGRLATTETWDPTEERRRLKLAQRDPAEFRWFYEEYAQGIRRFLQRLVRDRDVADDLMTETFAKALRGLGHYKWTGVRFGAYLHRIAANEAASYWRQRARRPSIELESAPAVVDPRRDALESLVVAEQLEQVLIEVERLGKFDRQVIDLFYWQEMGVAEIAARMQKPVGTIKARLKRARDKLQVKLEAANRPRVPAAAAMGSKPRKWLTWLQLRQRDLGRGTG